MDAEDLYVEEKQGLRKAMLALERFEFTEGNETEMKRRFEQAVATELGKVGFTAHVHWEEYVRRSPLGDIPTGVWEPNLMDVHRIKEETETDHDRKRHGIVTGLDGGAPGYIREDGTVHDEPRKKLIT